MVSFQRRAGAMLSSHTSVQHSVDQEEFRCCSGQRTTDGQENSGLCVSEPHKRKHFATPQSSHNQNRQIPAISFHRFLLYTHASFYHNRKMLLSTFFLFSSFPFLTIGALQRGIDHQRARLIAQVWSTTPHVTSPAGTSCIPKPTTGVRWAGPRPGNCTGCFAISLLPSQQISHQEFAIFSTSHQSLCLQQQLQSVLLLSFVNFARVDDLLPIFTTRTPGLWCSLFD